MVAGSGRARLGDEIIELRAWDVVRVAPAVMRSFEGGPDGMEFLRVGGRKPARGDTEKDPAFWSSGFQVDRRLARVHDQEPARRRR